MRALVRGSARGHAGASRALEQGGLRGWPQQGGCVGMAVCCGVSCAGRCGEGCRLWRFVGAGRGGGYGGLLRGWLLRGGCVGMAACCGASCAGRCGEGCEELTGKRGSCRRRALECKADGAQRQKVGRKEGKGGMKGAEVVVEAVGSRLRGERGGWLRVVLRGEFRGGATEVLCGPLRRYAKQVLRAEALLSLWHALLRAGSSWCGVCPLAVLQRLFAAAAGGVHYWSAVVSIGQR